MMSCNAELLAEDCISNQIRKFQLNQGAMFKKQYADAKRCVCTRTACMSLRLSLIFLSRDKVLGLELHIREWTIGANARITDHPLNPSAALICFVAPKSACRCHHLAASRRLGYHTVSP